MTLGKVPYPHSLHFEKGDSDILLVYFSGCLEDKELVEKRLEKYPTLYDKRRLFEALHMFIIHLSGLPGAPTA